MDRYWQGSEGIQEHQASWANSSPRAHSFPAKQINGWMQVDGVEYSCSVNFEWIQVNYFNSTTLF